jgi:DNA-binding Xre family transcriptional regulator
MYIVNLYNVRWERKYTQKEIVELTQLSVETVNKLFSGKYHDYRLSTLETISKFFKCKIHDILIEVEEK